MERLHSYRVMVVVLYKGVAECGKSTLLVMAVVWYKGVPESGKTIHCMVTAVV